MAQAIITKYHGPTNFRGARVSATSASGMRISIPWDYEGDTEDVHRRAAEALAKKMKWGGTLIGGGLKTGNAYVFLPSNCRCTGKVR